MRSSVALDQWLPIAAVLGVAAVMFHEWLLLLPTEALIALLVGTASLLLFRAQRVALQNELPFVDPCTMLLGVVLLRYAIGAIILYVWPMVPWTTRLALSWFEGSAALANIKQACILAVIGALGLFAGAAVRFPIARGPVCEPGTWRGIRELGFVLAIICHSVSTFVEPRVGTGYAHILHVPAAFSGFLLAMCAYFAASARNSQERWKWVLFCIVCYGLSILPGIRTGMREHFLKPLLLMAFGYVAARRRLPLLAFAGVIVLLVVVVLPVLNLAKQYATQTDFQSIERLERASAGVSTSTDNSYIELAAANLLVRINLLTMSAIFSDYYPGRRPFLDGESFRLEAISFVPRFLWPDKPEISSTLDDYSREVGIITMDDTRTSAKFDGLSEYFINFGAWGVLLLKMVEGLYYRVMHTLLASRFGSLIATLFIGCFIIDNGDCFGFFMLIPSHVQSLAVWGLMLVILADMVGKRSPGFLRRAPQPAGQRVPA